MSFIVERLALAPQANRPALTLPEAPSYQHLLAMSDDMGLFEHALFDTPRMEHGYCVDDVARGLIVGAREPNPPQALTEATQTYLDFVDEAVTHDGRVHNRRNVGGEWTDQPSVGDWWGRAIWGCGIAASLFTEEHLQDQARAVAFRAMQQESPFVRANVFAMIGAAELLMNNHEDDASRTFLLRSLATVPLAPSKKWEWPQERLTYANGSYVEALLAAGIALDDDSLVGRGLELLAFLLERESRDGHFSVTGVGGSDAFTRRPQFDQQPIEVSALADACVRAFDLTGDLELLDSLAMAWAWFEGDNDNGIVMHDASTGAGFDGLERRSRNQNCGAESTLAYLNTVQHIMRVRSEMREMS